MNNGIMLHSGGWTATAEEVEAAEAPEGTKTWVPLPHRDFLDMMRTHLPRFGLTIKQEQYALANEGARFFGVLTCAIEGPRDYGLAIGLRNSYDKTFAADVIGGTKVFICDNLAFSGEVSINRKHTLNLLRDLPRLTYEMLDRLVSMKGGIVAEAEAMKAVEIDDRDAAYTIIQSVKRGAMPGRFIQNVLEEWETPRHEEFAPRTAWSLYNAFTEITKGRAAQLQMSDTLRLTQLFRGTYDLESVGKRLAGQSGLIRPADLEDAPAEEPATN